jgi:hypothetical protein
MRPLIDPLPKRGWGVVRYHAGGMAESAEPAADQPWPQGWRGISLSGRADYPSVSAPRRHLAI